MVYFDRKEHKSAFFRRKGETRMDIELNYVKKGSGSPLVLLHGNGGNLDYFSNQIDCFAAHYTVYALDTRGHGASPRGMAPFTLSQFADDLYAFLLQQGIAKTHLLGFSDGGNIALLFCLKHGSMVDRLILNGADLSPKGVRPSVQLPIELGWRVARLFAGKSAEARRHAELLSLMVNEPNIAPETLKAILCPCLVLVGKNDMIKESHSRLIASSLPNAELVVLPGDHFLAARQPQAYNRAVLDFLKKG